MFYVLSILFAISGENILVIKFLITKPSFASISLASVSHLKEPLGLGNMRLRDSMEGKGEG